MSVNSWAVADPDSISVGARLSKVNLAKFTNLDLTQ